MASSNPTAAGPLRASRLQRPHGKINGRRRHAATRGGGTTWRTTALRALRLPPPQRITHAEHAETGRD